MDNTREQVYLAALLHDIGKFYQRADTGSVKTSTFLSQHSKVESVFCPLKDGYYTHKHVLWTAQFFEDFQSVFGKLTADRQNTLGLLAASHHLAAEQISPAAQIIKEADCLSSGMDRDSNIAYKDEQDELKGWDSFKTKAMISVLETIGLSNKNIESHPDWYHIPVKPLSLDDSCFPAKEMQTPDYENLWKKFIYEFGFIQSDTYHAFSETLLDLLFKYTSCIPSSTVNFPDVSLYDHLKTTAALAVCLYDFKKSGNSNENPFLLIGADFSGIQPYIYQIVSKYAGQNLKGRSFYLRLLSDAIVRFLLKELNLFKANIVYNSGGGFYLLAPNTKKVKEKLTAAINRIEKLLFENHGTTLYVAIDSIELSLDSLLHKNGENLGKTWGRLFEKRDKKKLHKFSSILSERYGLMFKPSMTGGDTKRDVITGDEFYPFEKQCSEGEISPLKPISKAQIELGKALRASEIMVVAEGDVPYWNCDKIHLEPIQLGYTYYFLKWGDLVKMKNELRASADKVTIVTLNGKDGNCGFMGDSSIEGVNNIYSLEFYGGNEMGLSGSPYTTYEEMCQGASDEAFKRLGVLRMDVDNLGNIFQKGIDPDRSTLSRFSTLSRSLDFFFSGYLNTIVRNIDSKRASIIYSGGDDVFIVGRWDVCVRIAEKIRNDFKRFACGNMAFTISGGIAVVPSKFPIMKGADESHIEENLAKNHVVGSLSKNSISFMHFPLNWEKEYYQVEALKNEIVKACCRNSRPLPKSFISKVLKHAANAKIKNHKFAKEGIRIYWMLTYDLCRMQSREEKQPLIERCKSEVCGNRHELNGLSIETDYHPLELWAFACRWAQLEMRTQNNY